MIDLTIHPDRLERAVRRARERNIIIPTFRQMRDPALIPPRIRGELAGIGLWDVNPRNLFRITWHNQPEASGGGSATGSLVVSVSVSQASWFTFLTANQGNHRSLSE